MLIYHGTYMQILQPEILRSEIGRDFGFAFYTTDIREQAERWAVRKAKIQSRRMRKTIQPIVNIYDWNERNDRLKVKTFSDASMEWLEMVMHCRSDIKYSHPYDIVVGKIADDNVGETVSYVMQGIMRKKDAVERLRFEKINNQIAFCTVASLSELTFCLSYIVGE